jgi:hypothetical protein
VVHTISEVPTPQGIVYSPETKKLFVASAKGKLYIYDGILFDLLTTIDFHGDARQPARRPAEKRVYVGFGDDETAAIEMVDATTNKRLDEEFKTGAHPESFQLETSGSSTRCTWRLRTRELFPNIVILMRDTRMRNENSFGYGSRTWTGGTA